MSETENKLSPLKEIYCINCYDKLSLNLSERRGEKNIICPKCKKSLTLKEAEHFLKDISPIIEGQCPACERNLLFNIDDRVSKEKIECPVCKDFFYIYEVENPKKEGEKVTDNTYIMLKHFYPDIRKTASGYNIKADTFNTKLFLILFVIIDITISLIISFIVMDNKRFRITFGEWLLDFLGYTFFGCSIPSLIVAWIIAKTSKGERKLSQNEIEEAIKKYKSRKEK